MFCILNEKSGLGGGRGGRTGRVIVRFITVTSKNLIKRRTDPGEARALRHPLPDPLVGGRFSEVWKLRAAGGLSQQRVLFCLFFPFTILRFGSQGF